MQVFTVIYRNLKKETWNFLTLCSYLVTYAFQSEFPLYTLVWSNGWVFVYKLSGCGFESRCSHVELLFLIKHASVWKYKSKKYYCRHSFTVATHLPQLFAVVICRGYLPWEFVVEICRSSLPWEFAGAICPGSLLQLFVIGIRCSYLS